MTEKGCVKSGSSGILQMGAGWVLGGCQVMNDDTKLKVENLVERVHLGGYVGLVCAGPGRTLLLLLFLE